MVSELPQWLVRWTAELDPLFDHVESQVEEIQGNEDGLMPDCASLQEFSRQLWALLGGLVKEQVDAKRIFANVIRHNGLEYLGGRQRRLYTFFGTSNPIKTTAGVSPSMPVFGSRFSGARLDASRSSPENP